MDNDEEDNSGVPPARGEYESQSAVNSLILDYYKKFGRKRDLEQYFSLSTAQSDIRDPSSVFWARMKTETESSDSGERSDKKSESSQELCRISIRFPAVDPCTSQEDNLKSKSESVSPPIIIEEVSQENSEDEAMKSDDNNSQKSYDVILDTSINKLHSPSSSITSQRKLEWDSLADVGYANESDRKTSASSLSTLERLALKQQYSNNDTQQSSNLGPPTAHSTPLDENEAKSKCKKTVGKKTTKIYKKDVDFLEVNVPHTSNMNPAQSINVNLTKHISFNVERDGKVSIDNVQKDISISPEKVSVETEVSPRLGLDKEIQTSLTKAKESNALTNIPGNIPGQSQSQKIPVLISLNTLRNRVRRKRLRMARRKLKSKKRADKENIPAKEKSGEPLSEAESFEYMPGHIYNQNQMIANDRQSNTADNKSSLESSGLLTTGSSKGSKHSFAKDLEKSIDLLKAALQQRCDDSTLRKQLIKQVCQRLLQSKYRDDESTTDFLSGLSFSSKKLGLGERNNTTTSTSDANNSTETSKRPKKSILRSDKFNPGSIASTSQSVPNLPVASKSEKLVTSNLAKNFTTSNTDSDMSSKEKTSSDNVFVKTSSEELYQKYLQALKREETYKRHLKDKEMFLKQKLVCSDSAFKVPVRVEVKPSNRLKDLMNDLTRNNYDDGSGDASKLEGGPGSNGDFDRVLPNRSQRSHSVFTLSSGNSECLNKKPNLKKRLQCDIKDLSKPGPSKDSHYCCCPHHSGNLKFGVTDSSVQVNIKNPCSNDSCPARQKKKVDITSKEEQKAESPRNSAKVISDDVTGDIKYVCICSNKVMQEVPNDFLIYKCSRLANKGVQLEETSSKASNEIYIQCNNQTCSRRNLDYFPSTSKPLTNKSSQTNMLIKMLHQRSSEQNLTCSDDKKSSQKRNNSINVDDVIRGTNAVHEATRWIQTEISINPKISEPTLSDINIVSDTNCAKLINEHYRELPKPSLTDVYSCQVEGSSESAKSDSYRSSGSSKYVDNVSEGDYPYATDKKQNINQGMNVEHSENFTIPIQGTNMTLMVSIGSERQVTNKKSVDMITHGTGTDRVTVIEQATCLTEECSKGVQADKLSNDSNTIDHNSNKICGLSQNKTKMTDTSNKPCMVNTCLTTEDSKYGTYPQTSPVNDRKQFRRSNTDIERVPDIKTGIYSPRSAGTEQILAIDTQIKKCKCGCSHNEGTCNEKCSYNKDKTSDPSNNKRKTCACGCPDSEETCKGKCQDKNVDPTMTCLSIEHTMEQLQKKCSCGCDGSIENCKIDCKERKSKPTDSKKTLDKPCGQKDFSDKPCKTCSCGCGGTISDCKEDCIERELSSREQHRNPPLRKEIQNQIDNQPCGQKDIPNTQIDQCPCGCGGTKDNCKEDCTELKLTPRECKKLTNKQVSVRKDFPEKQSQTCPCGCGGTKDSCKEDCIELKSTPRAQCKIQTNKQVSTQKDFTEKQTQKCPCGCGGTKDNCKKDCNELKEPPTGECRKQTVDKQISTQKDVLEEQSQKCPCGCGGMKDNCKKDCKKLKLPSSNLCGKPAMDKQISTQNDISLDKNEKCPCGCGGVKDNCKEDCVERKLTPRESKNPSSDKQLCGTKAFPDIQTEKCPCGCGGTKDNCKEDCSELNITFKGICKKQTENKKEIGTQKNLDESPRNFGECQTNVEPKCISRKTESRNTAHDEHFTKVDSRGEQTDVLSSDKGQKSSSETEQIDSDPILNMIQNITKKYSKKDVEKNKRKKCFKEIMTVLNYLLETDDTTDGNEDRKNRCDSTTTADETDACGKNVSEKACSTSVQKVTENTSFEKVSNKLVDKAVQPSSKKSKTHPRLTESSELPTSTDIPGTSSDSGTCKVLNKIKKECERYHQKRCKVHNAKKCDGTSSTSLNCDQCKRVHHCSCRNHKCKGHKKCNEKAQKSPVAYNLILQTSESIMSDGTVCGDKNRQLKNIIVKVPKKKQADCMPFREMAAKFERHMPCMPCGTHKDTRSRSCPNESEISSMEEIIRKSQGATVREYLEKNRPDFVERCSQRQTCLRYINESRATERAVHRDLLSLHVAQLPDVTDLDPEDLRRLAKDLGRHMRQKQPAPKFISEREMKKHSEKIYKSLPEVVQKKEEKRKENIKKTNLLMANMFKKNLQKKTLRGSVNLSNYSTVIKI